jgi:hypothetical protein
MAQNFIECDREQLLLMSPSLREWLPEDHLAWFVIDAVGDMDLSAFYARYRQDGWGRAAVVARRIASRVARPSSPAWRPCCASSSTMQTCSPIAACRPLT